MGYLYSLYFLTLQLMPLQSGFVRKRSSPITNTLLPLLVRLDLLWQSNILFYENRRRWTCHDGESLGPPSAQIIYIFVLKSKYAASN